MELVDFTFLHWAREREAIRMRRENGQPAPWTDDHILRNRHFCNVHREDDRATRWIAKNIREPYADHPDILRILGWARFLNWEGSLKIAIESGAFDTDPIKGQLAVDAIWEHWSSNPDERRGKGPQLFSPAYMIRSRKNEFKPAYVHHVMEETVDFPRKWNTRQEFSEALAAEYGWGSFLAGQIAADGIYTSLLRDAPDAQTYAPQGPGATRGANLAAGRDPDAKLKQEDYLAIGAAQMDHLLKLSNEFPRFAELTMHDVASNVNCETWKYHRMKSGGVPGRYYKARKDP